MHQCKDIIPTSNYWNGCRAAFRRCSQLLSLNIDYLILKKFTPKSTVNHYTLWIDFCFILSFFCILFAPPAKNRIWKYMQYKNINNLLWLNWLHRWKIEEFLQVSGPSIGDFQMQRMYLSVGHDAQLDVITELLHRQRHTCFREQEKHGSE